MVVRQGISVGFWKAMPTPLIGPVTFSPATRTSPDVAGSRPVTSFMMVDLPQPDGPDDGDELALVDAERRIGQGERAFPCPSLIGETDAFADRRRPSRSSSTQLLSPDRGRGCVRGSRTSFEAPSPSLSP